RGCSRLPRSWAPRSLQRRPRTSNVRRSRRVVTASRLSAGNNRTRVTQSEIRVVTASSRSDDEARDSAETLGDEALRSVTTSETGLLPPAACEAGRQQRNSLNQIQPAPGQGHDPAALPRRPTIASSSGESSL